MVKGSKHSPEAREKIRQHNLRTGKVPPSRLGVPNSPEQKEKIRASLKARGHKPPPMYGDDNPSKRPEVRAKISAALLGKELSPEHKASLSRNHRKVNPPSMQGANSHLWKGGVTTPNRRERQSPEYRAWRKAVFERDDYTCQNCGVHGGYLNADHIKPFSVYVDLRLDVDNGRTLCKPCHALIGWRGSHIKNRISSEQGGGVTSGHEGKEDEGGGK